MAKTNSKPLTEAEQQAHDEAQQEFADLEAKYQEYVKTHPETPGDVIINNEAPASLNWFAIAPTGENAQFTLRGPNFLSVMEEAAIAFEWLKQAGWVPKAVGPAAHPSQPAQSSKPAAPSTPPQGVPDQAYVPTPTYPSDIEVYRCVRMDVLPQPDGKVKLEFYGDEIKQPFNQFPSFRFTGYPKDAITKLQGVGLTNEADFKVARQYTGITWWVYWKEGREIPNSPTGAHYKNIIGVEPAQ